MNTEIKYREMMEGDKVVVRGQNCLYFFNSVGFEKVAERPAAVETIDCFANDVVILRCGPTHLLWVVRGDEVGEAGQHTSKTEIHERVKAVLERWPHRKIEAQTLAFAAAGDVVQLVHAI